MSSHTRSEEAPKVPSALVPPTDAGAARHRGVGGSDTLKTHTCSARTSVSTFAPNFPPAQGANMAELPMRIRSWEQFRNPNGAFDLVTAYNTIYGEGHTRALSYLRDIERTDPVTEQSLASLALSTAYAMQRIGF